MPWLVVAVKDDPTRRDLDSAFLVHSPAKGHGIVIVLEQKPHRGE
jgi:hypothetical protein